jgi:bacterioferritin-associated ferredoxin
VNREEEGKITVCRCSDVTLKEIRDLIRKGYTTLDEIKRLSRAGMGQCEGKTCRTLIMQEIAKATGKTMEEIDVPTFRPPIVTVPLKLIVEESKNEK